jgi:hypothetical protein
MPAARIAAISDRRAGADSEEGGTVESNSHLHVQRRYNGGSKTDIRGHNSRVYL